MDDKKKKARFEMIKKLAKEKMSDLGGIGEGLKGKKLSKVEVIAKDEEGLKKGLSKAQEILKAKLGEDSSDSDEEEEEECEACKGEGCSHCESEDEYSSEED